MKVKSAWKLNDAKRYDIDSKKDDCVTAKTDNVLTRKYRPPTEDVYRLRDRADGQTRKSSFTFIRL